MIKQMNKPCDAAPSATQPTLSTVERASDNLSGGAWWTATWTTTNLAGQPMTRQPRIVRGVTAVAVLALQVEWSSNE
jgi:hypothetical protein